MRARGLPVERRRHRGHFDRHQRICFAVALWNEQDPILKERLFGLTNSEGNHGEDVKEYYFYLDSTPTHSFMRYLYKYPQRAFPYAELVEENRRRGREAPEYELADTGIFDDRRYFDVVVEYAKGSPDDVLIKVRAQPRTRGCAAAPPPDRLVPQHVVVGYRERDRGLPAWTTLPVSVLALDEPAGGQRWLYCEGAPEVLCTENETNTERLYGVRGGGFYKDGINDAVVNGRFQAVNDAGVGTKASAHYPLVVPAGGALELRLRLTDRAPRAWREGPFSDEFERTWRARQAEADEFYQSVIPDTLSPDARLVMRQSLAGVLWSKQYYHYVVRDWLSGDPAQPAPPSERAAGRNHQWPHLYNADVISMPDKWEYPWYAA
jgi:hypothetical protein